MLIFAYHARATQLLSKKCLNDGEPLATLCSIYRPETWTSDLPLQRQKPCRSNKPLNFLVKKKVLKFVFAPRDNPRRWQVNPHRWLKTLDGILQSFIPTPNGRPFSTAKASTFFTRAVCLNCFPRDRRKKCISPTLKRKALEHQIWNVGWDVLDKLV